MLSLRTTGDYEFYVPETSILVVNRMNADIVEITLLNGRTYTVRHKLFLEELQRQRRLNLQ